MRAGDLTGAAASLQGNLEKLRLSLSDNPIHAESLTTSLCMPRVLGVALRKCPELPPTIAQRITDYRAQNVADWVMYRKALASAAEARGWPVHWYEAKAVQSAASQVLGVENLDAHFLRVRKAIGPPWDKDHKLAMSAAIVAASAVAE